MLQMDAALVHMLTDQKIKGNWGDNNPKKVAWSACKTALAGSEKNLGGTLKTVTAIKNQWQRVSFMSCDIFEHTVYSCINAPLQLKQEYEVIKEL